MGSQWGRGIRWLLVDNENHSLDALARELRFAGGQVRYVDSVGLSLGELARDDAHVVLVDDGQDIRFLRERMAFQAGFRSAAILRLPFAELFARGPQAPDLDLLISRVIPLLEPDYALRSLACGKAEEFQATARGLGVLRCLRAIASAPDVFRVTLRELQNEAQIELAGPLVLGARVERFQEVSLVGEEALAFAIELNDAEVTVRRKVRPDAPWLVMPLDEALERALQLAHDYRVAEHDDSPTRRIASPFAKPAPEQTTLLDSTPPASSVPTLSMRMPRRRMPVWGMLGGLALLVVTLLVGTRLVATGRTSSSAMVARAESSRPAATVGQVAAGMAAPVQPRSVQAEALPVEASPRVLEPVRVSTPVVPSEASELAARATEALARGELKLARSAAERAVALRPRKLQYRMLLGDVLAASGDIEGALVEFERGLTLRPGSRSLKERIQHLLAKPEGAVGGEP